MIGGASGCGLCPWSSSRKVGAYENEGLGYWYLSPFEKCFCRFPSIITTIQTQTLSWVTGTLCCEFWNFNYKNGVCSGCDHSCHFGDEVLQNEEEGTSVTKEHFFVEIIYHLNFDLIFSLCI